MEQALAECKTQGGQARLSPELFWSKDIIWFAGQGAGAQLEVPFEVPEEGDYELYTEVAQAADYGVYTVLLDGKPAPAPQLEHEPGADVRPQTHFDGYALETYVGLAHPVGWVRLAKGRHTLTYVCLGKREASRGYHLGVDNLILARVGHPQDRVDPITSPARGWRRLASEIRNSVSYPVPASNRVVTAQ